MIAHDLVMSAYAHRVSLTLRAMMYVFGCRYGVETVSLQYFDDPQTAATSTDSWFASCPGC